MSNEQDRCEMVEQILAEMQARQDDNPHVIYELRPDEDTHTITRPLRFDSKDDVLEGRDPWEQAAVTGDLLSGQLATHLDIFQVRIFTDLWGHETRRESSYVVSTCGGSQHWRDGDTLHQVGSAGFCWTCIHPDPDLDQVQRGLVRHPVTPAEIGRPAYRCFVCDEDMTGGRDEHLNVDHTVIWGEEHHPRCEACGGGYQTASPDGIDYEPHRADCPIIHPEG